MYYRFTHYKTIRLANRFKKIRILLFNNALYRYLSTIKVDINHVNFRIVYHTSTYNKYKLGDEYDLLNRCRRLEPVCSG